jgi:hypothetical protein
LNWAYQGFTLSFALERAVEVQVKIVVEAQA